MAPNRSNGSGRYWSNLDMVFRNFFNSGRRTAQLGERASLFREAWLLANRAILNVTMDAGDEGSSHDATPEKAARQWIRDEKISYSSDTRQAEELTERLLPWAWKVHSLSSRFSQDADVSSAHNTTVQRILELVGNRIKEDEMLDGELRIDDFSDRENSVLAGVLRSCREFWKSSDAL